MGVGVDGNMVLSRIQYIRFFGLVIIRRQIVQGEGDLDFLRFPRLKQLCLLFVNQVRSGLFNAAISVRWIEIGLHNILTGRCTAVGDGHRKAQLTVLLRDIAHLLLERGVA